MVAKILANKLWRVLFGTLLDEGCNALGRALFGFRTASNERSDAVGSPFLLEIVDANTLFDPLFDDSCNKLLHATTTKTASKEKNDFVASLELTHKHFNGFLRFGSLLLR